MGCGRSAYSGDKVRFQFNQTKLLYESIFRYSQFVVRVADSQQLMNRDKLNRKVKKSLRLQIIEALGLKDIIVSHLVYRPPRPSYTFKISTDFLNNRRLQFCILKGKRKIPVKSSHLEISPYLIFGKTSYCPAILLTSTKPKQVDSMVQTSVSQFYQRSFSSHLESADESSKVPGTQRTNSNLLTRVKDEYLQRSYVTKTTNHGKGQRILVVFSHGNASDLGDVYFFGERLIMQYDVDFLAYDYTGYGLGKNTFEISEKQIYDDLQNVLSFATVQLHYKLNQIVLWGFSLGSGPTVELASRLSSIGGVVLQAPLASLILWLEQQRETISPSEPDLYSNINKIQSIRSKMLIVHGNKDQTVNIRHSRLLYEKHLLTNANNVIFLEVGNADHNDLQELILQPDSELSYRIQHFLFYVEQQKILMESVSTEYDLLMHRIKAQQEQMERDLMLLSLVYDEITVSSDSLDIVTHNNNVHMSLCMKKCEVQPLEDLSLSQIGLHHGSYHDLMANGRYTTAPPRRAQNDKRNFLLFCGCNELD